MFIVYFLVWVALNGRFDLEVALFGLPVCAALTLFGRRFLGRRSGGVVRELRRLPRRLAYLGYLLAEIVKAAFLIMGMVFRPRAEVKPVLVYFEGGLRTDAGRAALADSITLTAGTIAVGVSGDTFCVHALDGRLAEGIEESGFARRIRELEE